jgi:hypothetical protein
MSVLGCVGVYHPAQPTHQTEKVFDGVPIYPSFEEVQREAQARGYLVVNAK